ncbi:MAG: hypothetical protein IT340_05965 [Chloroflexi bacterium]|nr:hypothetical protein [Chloroflexota bacterium]
MHPSSPTRVPQPTARSRPDHGRWRYLSGVLVTLALLAGCGAPDVPSPQKAMQTAAAVTTQVAGAATQVTGMTTQVAGAVGAIATAAGPIQGTAQAAATQLAPSAQAASTQVAGTAQAVATQVAPGAQAASTQVVGTAQAMATQMAPGASALATQMAPAIQAIATQVAGPAGAAIASQLASGPVQISATGGSPTDPTVTVRNSSSTAVPIGGYTLLAGTAMAVVPASVTASAGGSVTLHLGAGTTTASDAYLGLPAADVGGKLTSGARLLLFTGQGVPASVYTVP